VVHPQGTLNDCRIWFVVAFAAEVVKKHALRQTQENSPARNPGENITASEEQKGLPRFDDTS
jgi:hypothetical protein